MTDVRNPGAVEATERALENIKSWNADTKALITIADPFQPPVKKARVPVESTQNCSQCLSPGT